MATARDRYQNKAYSWPRDRGREEWDEIDLYDSWSYVQWSNPSNNEKEGNE